ncbi:MAG: hypothetical protein JW955_03415 [Sedimentisphaerales bacterium]|nr:hypothetical protein [Sedimentisphaerales bacterium]
MTVRRNSCAKWLTKRTALRLAVDVIDYFRRLSKGPGIPYQQLITLYIRECVHGDTIPTLRGS